MRRKGFGLIPSRNKLKMRMARKAKMTTYFSMTGLMIVMAMGLFGSRLRAEEVHSSKTTSTSTTLPHCIEDAQLLASIDQGRKDNAKNAFKYDKIKEALQSDSEKELVARLIYSETLAASCPELKNEVIPAIAIVIQNRIAKRKGDVRSVVFQRDQFASSLNGYDESKWREFLCPSDKALWDKSLAATATKSSVSVPGAYNYYLFKHSSRFQPPDWAKKAPLAFAGSDKITDCVKVFATDFK